MSEEEIINVNATKEGELNQKTRLLKSAAMDAFGFFGKNNPLVENKKSNNSFRLSAAGRPFKTEKDHTSISGTQLLRVLSLSLRQRTTPSFRWW